MWRRREMSGQSGIAQDAGPFGAMIGRVGEADTRRHSDVLRLIPADGDTAALRQGGLRVARDSCGFLAGQTNEKCKTSAGLCRVVPPYSW